MVYNPRWQNLAIITVVDQNRG